MSDHKKIDFAAEAEAHQRAVEEAMQEFAEPEGWETDTAEVLERIKKDKPAGSNAKGV